MNIKKVEKQLKKITNLVDAISDEDAISSIEKDLLLSYIRKMYQTVIDDSSEDHTKSSGKKKYDASEVDESFTAPTLDPVKENRSAPPIPNFEDAQSRVATPIDQPKAVETPVIEEVEEEKVEIPSELNALFDIESVSELSDKLSRTPIRDLNKCMGINEKIFTVRELFGGDNTLFNKTMDDLNHLSSVDDAKDYLIKNVAIEYDWANERIIKKADNFVKLISRRYV